MYIMRKRLYKGRAAINVLANSVENAREVFDAAKGYILVGLLARDFPSPKMAITAMKGYGREIDHAVSIGLGDGDYRQAAVVNEIAKRYGGSHINQVFPMVGMTRANLGSQDTWINGLVSPSGRVGYVDISTGPISAQHHEHAVVPIKAAIALIRDMGGNSLKFFPMNGLSCEAEYRAVAQACGEEQFALEPTGGINLDNFETILRIALEANVPQVIPHVYSAIIDKETGKTRVDDVRQLVERMKKLVDEYV